MKEASTTRAPLSLSHAHAVSMSELSSYVKTHLGIQLSNDGLNILLTSGSFRSKYSLAQLRETFISIRTYAGSVRNAENIVRSEPKLLLADPSVIHFYGGILSLQMMKHFYTSNKVRFIFALSKYLHEKERSGVIYRRDGNGRIITRALAFKDEELQTILQIIYAESTHTAEEYARLFDQFPKRVTGQIKQLIHPTVTIYGK